MNKALVISAISLIAVMMVVGVVSPAMAKEGNNGSNGCEKSNPNSKACEKNPNADSDGDGVPNRIDQCPDTPEGVSVNELGCPEPTVLTGIGGD